MHAFRCKTCGHFETSAQACEEFTPHACSVCSSGVSFNPKTGKKIINAENWEVLADCSPERLAELGLDGQVETHLPSAKAVNVPKAISLENDNTLGIIQRTP